MKIKQSARNKYAWYLQCSMGKSTFTPIQYDPNGYSAIEAFHLLESTGVRNPCHEPDMFHQYESGKMSHGITVEAYVSSLFDFTAPYWDNCWKELPAWVIMEIKHQAKRYALSTIGFIPKFIDNVGQEIEIPTVLNK